MNIFISIAEEPASEDLLQLLATSTGLALACVVIFIILMLVALGIYLAQQS